MYTSNAWCCLYSGRGMWGLCNDAAQRYLQIVDSAWHEAHAEVFRKFSGGLCGHIACPIGRHVHTCVARRCLGGECTQQVGYDGRQRDSIRHVGQLESATGSRLLSEVHCQTESLIWTCHCLPDLCIHMPCMVRLHTAAHSAVHILILLISICSSEC